MKHDSTLWKAAVLAFLAVAPSQGRADYMDWTYTTSVSPADITALGGTSKGGATVAFSGFSTPQGGAGAIPILAYTTSTAYKEPINWLQGEAPPFFLKLTITDSATNQSGTITFLGNLWGSLTASKSSVVAWFAPMGEDPQPVTVVLGGTHAFTVTIPATTPLAPPSDSPGDIMATVSVADVPKGPFPGPEPSSLLLGSMGLCCFGIGCWWKRWRLTGTLAAA